MVAPAFSPTAEKTKIRRLPPYNVIVIREPCIPECFVIEVIQKVFGYAEERIKAFIKNASKENRMIVWTGTKEVAEFKCEQVLTFRDAKKRNLQCYIEPSTGKGAN